MKGKKILALASIFAGVALVGSTFAAWAVTDNAPTQTIKISGEKVQADGTYYVTLTYGNTVTIADVANLAVGTSRYAGQIDLVATYSGTNAYNGKLTVAMSQAAKEGAKLINYLKVDVYNTAPTYNNDTKIVSAAPTGEGVVKYIALDGTAQTPVTSGSYSIAMTSGTAKSTYFVVSLANNIEAGVLNQIKSDQVTLTIDWDHETTNQTIASSTKVYWKPTLGEGDVAYCYAWKGTVWNAEYPGLPMTDEGNGIYSYAINTTSFDKFILCYGKNNSYTKAREADFAVSDVVGSNNYWSGTAWTTVPVADPTLTANYYVVGDFNSWTCHKDYALVAGKDGENQDCYQVTNLSLAQGAKLKARTNSNNASEHWYSCVDPWDNCGFTIDNEGNLVVSQAGTYTVRLYPNATNNNYLVLVKTSA